MMVIKAPDAYERLRQIFPFNRQDVERLEKEVGERKVLRCYYRESCLIAEVSLNGQPQTVKVSLEK